MVKRFAFEVGQSVRISILDSSFAHGPDKEAGKPSAQANILRAVKVAAPFLRSLCSAVKMWELILAAGV